MIPVVDLALKPSARAHHLMFWLHVLPLALLPMTMESGPWMLLVAFAIGASWLGVRRHAAFGYGPRAIAHIQADAQGRWSIANAAGTRLDVEPMGDSVVLSWLLVLNFRGQDGRRRTRVLFGDEASEEALRRLRTRLAAGISNPPKDSA
jgi:toxin CptA